MAIGELFIRRHKDTWEEHEVEAIRNQEKVLAKAFTPTFLFREALEEEPLLLPSLPQLFTAGMMHRWFSRLVVRWLG